MKSKAVGDLSELMVLTELHRRNYDVLIPYGDRLPYDLVCAKEDKFIRIQVKTAFYNKPTDTYVGDARRKLNKKHVKVETDKIDYLIFKWKLERVTRRY